MNEINKCSKPLLFLLLLSLALLLGALVAPHAANLNPQVTASWDGLAPDKHNRRGPPGYAMEMSERGVAAKMRFEQALKAVGLTPRDVRISGNLLPDPDRLPLTRRLLEGPLAAGQMIDSLLHPASGRAIL